MRCWHAVIRSAKASAAIDRLRMKGRGRLADRVEEIVAELEADPEGHRGVGFGAFEDGGGGFEGLLFAGCCCGRGDGLREAGVGHVEVAGDVAVVGWELEDGDVVVLDVRYDS